MAETPWGPLAVSDAHVHFLSRPFYDHLHSLRRGAAGNDTAGELGHDAPPADPLALAQRWADELSRHGVDRAALISSTPGDEGSVATAVRAFPGRLFGWFMFDPLQPDAPARLARAFDAGLHCACLFPSLHGYDLTDPKFLPTFAAAADRRAILFVHCGVLTIGARAKLGIPTPTDLRRAHPFQVQVVAQHFPDLRFIIPHFGGGLLREALMSADLCPNIWLDTSSSNRWTRYEGLELREVFRRTIDTIGIDRILFGTDSGSFPRGWQTAILTRQATALYELGLDAQQAQAILSTNFERLIAHPVA